MLSVKEMLPKKNRMDKFLMLSLVGVVLTLILALIYYFGKVSDDDFHNMDAYSYSEESDIPQ